MGRPSWDETFIAVAQVIAERSTCPRLHVGVVIATPTHHVISIGYNGAPAGQPHCTDVGCAIGPTGGCQRAVHAEINALLQAGVRAQGATLYSTVEPCYACAASIVNARVARVVYLRSYPGAHRVLDPTIVLTQGGVELVQFSWTDQGVPGLVGQCHQ